MLAKPLNSLHKQSKWSSGKLNRRKVPTTEIAAAIFCHLYRTRWLSDITLYSQTKTEEVSVGAVSPKSSGQILTLLQKTELFSRGYNL